MTQVGALESAHAVRSGSDRSLRYLILLGLICQGFASQSAWWAVLFGLVGWLAMRWARQTPLMGDAGEAVVVGITLVAAWRGSRMYEFPLFVSLGYPILLLQLNRLTGPMDERKRLFSAGIALVHVAIGSLAVFDWKFPVLFVGALILLPRTFHELEAERFGVLPRRNLRRDTWLALGLVAFSAVFFVLAPRPKFRARGGGFNAPMLDPTSGGAQVRARPLFQVEGENLGYLKSYALDSYRGKGWAPSTSSFRKARSLTAADQRKHLKRTVEFLATDASLYDIGLPIDGHVIDLKVDFFQSVFVNFQGTITTDRFKRGSQSRSYEYWTDTAQYYEPIEARARKRLLELGPTSARLQTWLDGIAGRETDPRAQAERIATYLRENFTYTIGAPSLERVQPVEDFVFNQKTGHCERFAAALAVLLRMKGIPARIAVGYLPLEKYRSGSVTTITTAQGHAWTEAWFERVGWVTLDATPYSGNIYGLPQPLHLRIEEWIADFWYQKVVFFGSAERSTLLHEAAEAVRVPVRFVGAHLPEVVVLAFSVGLIGVGLQQRRRGWSWFRGRARSGPRAVEQARHFYGQMLRTLERRGHRRRAGQTPLEFLRQMQSAGAPLVEDVDVVTQLFCSSRYRETPLEPAEMERVQASLRRIAKGGSPARG